VSSARHFDGSLPSDVSKVMLQLVLAWHLAANSVTRARSPDLGSPDTLALGMRDSSVEAMQDFGSLLRKSPASLLVMLRIDECSAPNRKLHLFRSTFLAGNVSRRD
jgi:hypothetical protein